MRYPDRFSWPDGVKAAISLTFDDARESQLIHGLPILDAYDVKASFYVSLPTLDLRLDQWQRVAEAGHEIGNHSTHHVCSGNFCWDAGHTLEDYDLPQREADILGAQADLKERFGFAPRTFAYPCGQSFVGRGEDCRSYTPIVAANFIAGRRFRDEVFNDPSFSDLARLAGTEGDCCSFEQLLAMLTGAKQDQAWIVLALHDVGTDQLRQVLSTDALDKLCAYCRDDSNGIWIDPVEHIADYVRQNRTGR